MFNWSRVLGTLDHVVTTNRMSGLIAVKMLDTLDRVIAEVLARELKATIRMTRHTRTLNEVNEVLFIRLRDVRFEIRPNGLRTDEVQHLLPPFVNVVACKTMRS